MIIFVIFSIFKVSKSPITYRTQCYYVQGKSRQTFQTQISSEVEFLPDTLLVKLSIEERSTDDRLHRTREIQYFIKETSENCEESAFLPPNMIPHSKKTMKFTAMFLWTDKVEIERFEMEVFPDFSEQKILWEGATKRLKTYIHISPSGKDFHESFETNVRWTGLIKTIDCRMNFCVRVFKKEGLYSFLRNFRCPPKDIMLLDRFQILEVSSFADAKMENLLFREHFVAEIVPCYKRQEPYSFPINWDHSIKVFEIKIEGPEERIPRSIRYSLATGRFDGKSSDVNFPDVFIVDIRGKQFSDAWKERSHTFLLQKTEKVSKKCTLHRKKEVELKYVLYDKDKYLVESFVWVIRENRKFKYLTTPTSKQVEKCERLKNKQ